MIVMRNYQVIVSEDVLSELDNISTYIASFYRQDSGHKYVNRILGKLASLCFAAEAYPISSYSEAKKSHPEARTMSIINHRWTVIFHIDRNLVMIDCIIPSKMIR